MRTWWLLVGFTLFVIVTPAFGTQSAVEREDCPNLAGTYSDSGATLRDGKVQPGEARLSWLLFLRAKETQQPLFPEGRRGVPSTNLVHSMRVHHPSRDRFKLEALGGSGEVLGTFDFGPETHWFCEGGAFVIRNKTEFGTELKAKGDLFSVQSLALDANGTLIRKIRSEYQHRSYFAGVPVGSPQVNDREYRFEPVEKGK